MEGRASQQIAEAQEMGSNAWDEALSAQSMRITLSYEESTALIKALHAADRERYRAREPRDECTDLIDRLTIEIGNKQRAAWKKADKAADEIIEQRVASRAAAREVAA